MKYLLWTIVRAMAFSFAVGVYLAVLFMATEAAKAQGGVVLASLTFVTLSLSPVVALALLLARR